MTRTRIVWETATGSLVFASYLTDQEWADHFVRLWTKTMIDGENVWIEVREEHHA
jgi:hypothetical protein